jgi:fumarate hydratase class I
MNPTSEIFERGLLELIRRTSSDLPSDVEAALRRARASEEKGSAAEKVLQVILQNIELARERGSPLCQDTGTPIFFVCHPLGLGTTRLRQQIEAAVVKATELSYLRPNAVHSLTGENSGNNLGRGLPQIHFEEWERDQLRVDLMLKGGGSENVAAQYKLPDSRLNAGRDLDGVKKVVLDAVFQAQGRGCAPGVLGVGIGGDRSSSYVLAKKQLFRKLTDANEDELLRQAEQELFEKANQLEIGPMGFGGKTTVLAVKMGWQHRHPASFFVSIAYMCWADRRRSLIVQNGGYEIL